MKPFRKVRRGYLVGITADEQKRVGVLKDRPWLILQNNNQRDSGKRSTVLACYLTDAKLPDETKRDLRHGDVEFPKDVSVPPIQKDSVARLADMRPIVEDEIVKYRGRVSLSYMILVDKVIRELLTDDDYFRDEASIQTKQEKKTKRKR